METVRNEAIPAVIALVLIGVSAYLWVQGIALPDGLKVLTASVVSFYYGGKTATVTAGTVRSAAVKITNGGTSNGH